MHISLPKQTLSQKILTNNYKYWTTIWKVKDIGLYYLIVKFCLKIIFLWKIAQPLK